MTIDGPGVGATWQGEYLLQATLGDPERGVFRAQRRSDSQTVALRVWRAQSDAQANEFLETALSACGVRHPALAHVEATGREAEHCYIVTEYVVGQKLDTWADHVGIPPLPQVVELMRRICEGLSVASDSKLVHSALHPRNIAMLPAEAANDRTLHPKLLDLGVPTAARARSIHPLTAQFMAPEQLQVALEPSAPSLPDTTTAMNVYSCGALLYFLCTGGPPFRQVELSALRQAHSEGRLAVPSRINPQISQPLNAVIVKALAQDPAQRFGSMAELGSALAGVNLTVSATAVRPVPSLAPPAPSPARKRPSGAFVRASVVPPSATRRPPTPPPADFDEEGDTAKTDRPAPSSRPPAARAAAPMGKAAAAAQLSARAAPPVGSFSSAPPPAPSRPPQAVAATPVALFSNAPKLRTEPSVIVARFDPSASALLAPEEAIDSPAPRQALTFGVLYGILAVIACFGTFAAVRLIRSPQQAQGPTPLVTVENAATRPFSSPAGSYAAPPASAAPAAITTATASEAAEPAEPAEPAESELVPHEPIAHLEHAKRPVLDEAAQVRGARARGLRGAMASASRPEVRPAAVAPAAATPDAQPEPPPEPSVPPEPPPAAPEVMPPVDESELQLKPMPQESEPAVVRSTLPLVPFEPPRPSTAKPTLFAARAEVSEIVLRGSIPTSKIRRAIDRVRPQLSACYGRAAAAAGRNQFGVVDVELEIDERGRVRSPRARGAGLPGLNGCVAQAAGDVISEVPDTGTVRVSFQVTFTP